MMTLTTTEIRALFVLFPAVASAARYRNGRTIYRPFFVLMWIGALCELVSIVGSHLYHTNVLNTNVYVLLEYGLLLFFFSRFDQSGKNKWFIFLFLSGTGIWIIDNFWLHPPTSVNSLFRVYYSIVIIAINLRMLNHSAQVREPAFLLILLGCVLYYSCKAFIESFYMLHLHFSREFYYYLFQILSWINLTTNLVYTAAILCIPTKQASSIRY